MLVVAICLFCFEVPQVLLPNSRPLSVEAPSVTVSEQSLPTPQANAAREVVNKGDAKANAKQTTMLESNKSAKPGKKQQGISR